MNGISVKICGLKNEKDVHLCLKLGVDILGFVTEYPIPVPWSISQKETKDLLNLVSLPHRSCIVTGGSPEKIIKLAEKLRPSMLQLHYQETLEETILISEALKELNVAVVKTVPALREDRIRQFGTSELKVIVDKLCQTEVYGLLVDSRGASNASARGSELDVDLCLQVLELSKKPVIIAGGIKAGNVSEILSLTGAKHIDIMTGVEKRPGEKDGVLLSCLMAKIDSFNPFVGP